MALSILGQRPTLEELRAMVSQPSVYRKAVMETMAKAKHQAQGLPDVQLIREAITEPALFGKAPGASGFALMRGDPDASATAGAAHRTYTHAIPGDYLGQGPVLSWQEYFPDVARSIAGLSPAQQIGSLRMKRHMQPVTLEVLENLYGK